jgi:(p)ppGpp synthase/HD superfamily hydrolase
LAEAAHRSQRRPTYGRPFISHVTEVAALLHREAFDEELVAAGLLHDAVEQSRSGQRPNDPDLSRGR